MESRIDPSSGTGGALEVSAQGRLVSWCPRSPRWRGEGLSRSHKILSQESNTVS